MSIKKIGSLIAISGLSYSAMNVMALKAMAQTSVTITSPAGARQTFKGLGTGMSNWGGEYQTLSQAQRTNLAQLLWRDTKFKVLRMWFNTNEFEPTPGVRNLTQMKTNYLDSGIVTDAVANGVTELLLAPEKMPPHMIGRVNNENYILDSQIGNYANLIADGIKMVKDQYNINITATGIQNEPNNNHQGSTDAMFTPAQVVACVKALRSALNARGLSSVQIIAPESGSADQYLWDCVDALKADSAAWNALDGISSHSYNIATNDTSGNRIAASDGSNLKDYWQSEASDNGSEDFGMTGVPALRAASLTARFLNDMNHRVTHWAHFIGFEKSDINDNGTRIGYYSYPANNHSLTLLKKYYTYKQMGNAFDVGAIFRDSVSSLDGDMMWGWQKKPRVISATAKNPDGSWTVGIQNFTADSFNGLQSGGDSWNSEQGGYTPAQSFNVTIKITELQNAQPITFNITKTTGSVLNQASGTVTMTNGVMTIPVNSLDTVTLRSSGTIVLNPTPTPTPIPTGKIRYWPRTPYGSRMQYGIFEGSNDLASTQWTTLATINNPATEGQWNEVPAPETINYRYVRYRSAAGGYGNVAEIEFYSNGVKLTGTPFGSPAYAGGSNTFVKAFDNDTSSFFDGNDSEGYAGLDLGVTNGAAPTVSLTSPSNGASFTPGSTINLAASASDSDGTVSKVEFFAGTTKLGEDLAAPYTLAWNNVPAGTYSVTAKATDNSGNVTSSSPITLTIAAPNTAPTVSLTSPSDGATISAGAVSLTANASDSDGTISKVEFFQGSTKLGEDTSAPYEYAWIAAAGSYSITAKATDNSGATTTSAAANITVSAPPTGNGTGLKGDYFSTKDLTPLVSTRIDPTINFDWGTGNATTSVGPDNFSVRWTGQVQAIETGTYTFSTNADDGVRLWVNGTQLINDWAIHGPTVKTGTISLTAGQKYNIKLEYFEESSGASVQLGWIRPGQTSTAIIPQSQLYPPAAGASPTVSLTAPANNASVIAGSTVSLAATASDSDGTISKVEFFQGSTKLGEDTSSPYTYAWTAPSTAGTYTLTAKAMDDSGNVTTSSAVSVNVTAAPTGSGTITRDVWTGVSGTAIADIPVGTAPTSSGTLTSFEGPTDAANNYAARIRGYITAPATGSYTFWVAGDDNVALYLSTDSNPANKTRIAFHNEWTGSREWNKFASQKSATINLTAGTQYYVEVLHKEGEGGDNVAVGWLKPGQSGSVPSEVVPGSALSPYSAPTNAAPSVSLTSPTNGANFTAGNAISLAANASDSDGTISKVEFFAGTTKLGEDTSAPYAYSWTGAAAGSYSLTAKATDNSGAVTTSSAINITVATASNNPPTVSLTSPANGTTFTAGSTISLAANASDSDGTISKVEFFQGSTKLGEDTSSPYTYSWTGATAGTYSLTAKATDNSGNVTTSATVSITVTSGSTSSGTVVREVWTGVSGSTVGNIPVSTTPNITDTLTSLEGPSDWADSYGQRIKGYITAPTTGPYTFWIAGDDAGELWLSTDSNSANKVKIASFFQYTGSRNWNAYGVQKSATISLTAGQKYYVEVLHKEGAGGDSIAVGWLKPGQTGTAPSEVVPGSVLSSTP